MLQDLLVYALPGAVVGLLVLWSSVNTHKMVK